MQKSLIKISLMVCFINGFVCMKKSIRNCYGYISQNFYVCSNSIAKITVAIHILNLYVHFYIQTVK
jgi:hypothetical protein